MIRVGIELGQEISQYERFEICGTDKDVFATRLLEIDRIVQLLLHLKCLKQVLQLRYEEDDGRDDKDGDEKSTCPVARGKVTVAYRAHGNQDEIVGLEEGEVVVMVDAKEMVE